MYSKPRRDHLGIILMVIATILVLSGIFLLMIIGLVLTVVLISAGLALLLIGAYLDSNVRVRYQRKLPPIDRPTQNRPK